MLRRYADAMHDTTLRFPPMSSIDLSEGSRYVSGVTASRITLRHEVVRANGFMVTWLLQALYLRADRASIFTAFAFTAAAIRIADKTDPFNEECYVFSLRLSSDLEIRHN